MKKFIGRLFWIIVILLMCLWTFEFYRIRNGLDPMFTYKEDVKVYPDGVTTVKYGIGYKVYDYNRTDLLGVEFVSMFAKERTNGLETPKVENNIDTNEEVPQE